MKIIRRVSINNVHAFCKEEKICLFKLKCDVFYRENKKKIKKRASNL